VSDQLESFYARWHSGRTELIDYDNACAIRKVDTIVRNVPQLASLGLRSAIDFGCGRGRALRHFFDKLHLQRAYGFDFSQTAVDYATAMCGSAEVRYHRLRSLDIDDSIEFISDIAGKVDCVLLLDLLEHVPDCQLLVSRLAEVATYFVIKLPVEANLLDNYVLRHKIYPSTRHYNGHLREFNANSVFYFVRKLGLTPLAEDLYRYDPDDLPSAGDLSLSSSIKHVVAGLGRAVLGAILHKKLFIAVCGPGGYYCVATFNRGNVLNP
jgi:SAM-dependent methyltransferase